MAAKKTQDESTSYVPTKNDKVLADGTVIINGNKRIKVFIPKIPNEKVQEDVVITVNGHTIIIQRGAEVEIPREYYEVLQQSFRMQEMADGYYFAHAQS